MEQSWQPGTGQAVRLLWKTFTMPGPTLRKLRNAFTGTTVVKALTGQVQEGRGKRDRSEEDVHKRKNRIFVNTRTTVRADRRHVDDRGAGGARIERSPIQTKRPL